MKVRGLQETSQTEGSTAVDALPSISATDFKKDFANVFRRLGSRGTVAVVNHRQARAVLVGVEEYAELARLRDSLLGSLEAEFDRSFAAMQESDASSAVDALFSSTPEQLGSAAITKAGEGR